MNKIFEKIKEHIYAIYIVLFIFSLIGLTLLEDIRNSKYDLMAIEVLKLEVETQQLIEDCVSRYFNQYTQRAGGIEEIAEEYRDRCSEFYYDKTYSLKMRQFKRSLDSLQSIDRVVLPWSEFLQWIKNLEFNF